MALLFEKIRRWSSSRGFGVQSPFAFSFLHDVIRQKNPYYAYEDLKIKRLNENDNQNSLQVDELLFRLTNFLQPDTVVLPSKGWNISQQYVTSAYHKAHVESFDNINQLKQLLTHLSSVDMICIESGEDLCKIKSELFEILANKAIIVITNIHKNLPVWKELLNDERISISFDLYSLGILIFMENVTFGRYLATVFK